MRTTMRWLALLPLAGCVYGDVRDADTGADLQGVTVIGLGDCSTAGCDSTTVHTVSTSSSGYYEFDPYDAGGIWDDANGVHLQPPAGKNAIGLIYLKSGYGLKLSFQAVDYAHEFNDVYTAEMPDLFMTSSGTAIDYDGDGMTDAEELRLGLTSAVSADTDGDGIDDKLEVHGTNYMSLLALGADPSSPDLFVECDYMPGFQPSASAMDDVVDRFAEHGITLHLDIDDEITGSLVDFDIGDVDDVWDEFDDIKDVWFDRADTTVHHYCLFTQAHSGGASTGLSRGIGGLDFIISLDSLMGDEVAETGTFLHEFGHNLGLRHGGDENLNCKPNYLSVMNYLFQLTGLRRDGSYFADYSDFTVAPLNESNLDERDGLDPGDAWLTETELARYRTRNALNCVPGTPNTYRWTDRADRNIDWNRNGLRQSSVSANINGDRVGDVDTGAAVLGVLTSHNDWLNLDLSSSFDGSGAGAAPGSLDWGETFEDAVAELAEQRARVDRPARRIPALVRREALSCAEVPEVARRPRFTSPDAARSWRARHTATAAVAWRQAIPAPADDRAR